MSDRTCLFLFGINCCWGNVSISLRNKYLSFKHRFFLCVVFVPNAAMLLLGVLMCVSVSQSWRLMPELLVPYEPKETWQRTRKTSWENSLKYLGNNFPQMLKFDALKKLTLNFILSSCQYLNRAPSRRSPQGCQRWAPHHHRLSVSADLFLKPFSTSILL